MNPLAGAAIAAPPAVWALQHFRSPAVHAWTRPTLPGDEAGPLYARFGGDGDQAVVLLHGLVSSGDVFGAAYDQLATIRRVVVPDLLGFGRSMDESRSSFSVDEHLDALDQLAGRLGLFDRRWTIGAHSMGSALALCWAARHRERVERVVCWGAPIYPSPEAARTQISGSVMTRLFVLDTNLAERACAINCRHRTAAGWLTAAFEPTLPVPIARAVSLHTWPAYRDAMRHLVVDTDWRQLLNGLDTNGISVELVRGTKDTVGDHHQVEAITAGSAHSVLTLIEDAGHHLPMTHPEICRGQLIAPADDRPVV
jgi:pimeloyl-ACP methyl ester carboxylesterase